MSYSQWANFVNYEIGDRVSYLGLSYLALQPSLNVLPTTLAPRWQVIVNPNSSPVLLDRISSTAPTVINALTAGTAQVLLTLTVNPAVVCDLMISGVMTFSMTNATLQNLIFFVSVDGVQTGGQFRDSGQGIGHFINPTVISSALAVAPGPRVIRLLAYASIAGVFTQSVSQLTVLANLS
jgi:hypothetical protein